MPLHSFYTLAEEVGKPKQTLIFMEYIPRSGSTLLCNIFEETGQCVTFYGANAFTDWLGAYGHDPYEAGKLIEAQLRLLCKPRTQMTSAFVFKTVLKGSKFILPHIHRSYPDAKFLFLYRNGIDNINSRVKISSSIPHENLIKLIFKPFPVLCIKLLVSRSIYGHDLNPALLDKLYISVNPAYFMAACTWAYYIHMFLTQQSDKYIPTKAGVKYENLIENPKVSVAAIFSYCGLSKKLVSRALLAMGRDSQEGTPFSKSELLKKSKSTSGGGLVLSKETKMDLDLISQIMNVPSFLGKCILPKTITEQLS